MSQSWRFLELKRRKWTAKLSQTGLKTSKGVLDFNICITFNVIVAEGVFNKFDPLGEVEARLGLDVQVEGSDTGIHNFGSPLHRERSYLMSRYGNVFTRLIVNQVQQDGFVVLTVCSFSIQTMVSKQLLSASP